MSQYNNTAESRKNKHLTIKERYTIEILLKEGLNANCNINFSKKMIELRDYLKGIS